MHAYAIHLTPTAAQMASYVCMCVSYVCMCVSYVCMCVRIHASMRACMHAYACIQACALPTSAQMASFQCLKRPRPWLNHPNLTQT